MFCQFCGKNVAEGETCGCEKEREVLEANNKKIPTNMIIAAASVVVVLILLILLIASIGGSGYKKAVKQYVKSYNTGNGELMVEVLDTEKELRYYEKYYNTDYDDMCDDYEDDIDETIDYLEDEYGDDVKISVKFGDKEKLDEDDIEEIEDACKNVYGSKVTIQKAYELECTFVVKGDDDKDDEDMDIIVIKVKDEGWKLYNCSSYSIYYLFR